MTRTIKSGLFWAAEIAVWAFALYSLYSVLRYGGAVVLDPSTTSRIMGIVNSGGEVTSAIGLTYHGLGGAALVVIEELLVIGAMVLSYNKAPVLRRAALIVFIAWVALWLGNSIWMETLSDWRHASRPELLAVAIVGAVTRAGLRWRVSPTSTRPHPHSGQPEVRSPTKS